MADLQTKLLDLEARKSSLLGELATMADLRPGSLSERFLKCGKPSCRCHQPGGKGHGPFLYLTRKVGGKTASWLVPSGGTQDLVHGQVDEYKRFRIWEQAWLETCELLSDARLEAAGNASSGMAKRGAPLKGSKTPSPPKSGGKSTRS